MEFRKVTLENLERLSEMFRLCLHREVGEEYFLWKYKNNPAGEVIAFEAVEGDTIAAFYGLIPEWYWVEGKAVKVYQSMDTMTHPDFQKRGLFVKLAQMTYDYILEKENQIYIVGIPGSNSFHGFVKKLNWAHVHDFSYLFMPRWVLNIKSIFWTSKKISIQEVTTIDTEFETFLNAAYEKETQLICPKIDAKVLQWKLFAHPFKQFKCLKIYESGVLQGYCIAQIEAQNIKIEYFLCIAKDKKKALNACIQYFKSNVAQFKFIYAWQASNPVLARLFQQCGFIKNPFKKAWFSYKVPFITYARSAQNPKNTWGNIDQFDLQSFMQD